MNIRTKTLASDILSYLNENGEVVRKNLYVPFSEYAYQYYARTLRRLIDEGNVETKRVSLNSVTTTRVSLTKKGQEFLRDSAGDTPNKKKDSKTRPRRQQLVDRKQFLQPAGRNIKKFQRIVSVPAIIRR